MDEFCAVCGYHRKYALRRLNEPKKQATRKKPGKPSRYDCAEVMVPLRAIWLATDQMASKRLKVAIPLWLPHYDLYTNEFSLLNNFFCPTMKLFEKKRVGAKVIKKHAKPETPVQRLLAHPAINFQQKTALKNIYNNLNPFVLRSTIQKKLNAILKLVR